MRSLHKNLNICPCHATSDTLHASRTWRNFGEKPPTSPHHLRDTNHLTSLRLQLTHHEKITDGTTAKCIDFQSPGWTTTNDCLVMTIVVKWEGQPASTFDTKLLISIFLKHLLSWSLMLRRTTYQAEIIQNLDAYESAAIRFYKLSTCFNNHWCNEYGIIVSIRFTG